MMKARFARKIKLLLQLWLTLPMNCYQAIYLSAATAQGNSKVYVPSMVTHRSSINIRVKNKYASWRFVKLASVKEWLSSLPRKCTSVLEDLIWIQSWDISSQFLVKRFLQFVKQTLTRLSMQAKCKPCPLLGTSNSCKIFATLKILKRIFLKGGLSLNKARSARKIKL